MPKLPEFDAGPGKLQPNSQAENAALLRARRVAQTADALGRAFGGVADLAEQHQEHQELTNGAKLTSQFEVDEEIRHREFDWSQPDAANKYLEGFHERVAKLGEQLNAKTPGGKEYFARWAGDATTTFGRQAVGAVGDAEGIASHQATRETVANKQTLAGLSFDRLDSAIDGVKGEYTPDKKPPAMDEAHWADYVNANQSADLAGTVIAAYGGLTTQAEKEFRDTGKTSPAYDRATAEIAARHGFEYLDPKGNEGTAIQKELEDAKERGLAEHERLQSADRINQRQVVDAKMAEFQARIGQPGYVPTAADYDAIKTMSTLPTITGPEVESMTRAISTAIERHESGTDVKSDNATMADFNHRVGLPADQGGLTYQQNNDAFNAGKESREQWSMHNDQIKQRDENPNYGKALSLLDRQEQIEAKTFGITDPGDPMAGVGSKTNTARAEAYAAWVAHNRAVFAAWTKTMDPLEAASIMVDHQNGRNFYKIIPNYLAIADSQGSASGVDAFLLSHPFPVTQDQNPNVAQAAQLQAPPKSVPPPATVDAAVAARHQRK